jgi:hypothetical protein
VFASLLTSCLQKENLRLRQRTLRRLAIHFEKQGDVDKTQQLCDMVLKQSGNTLLPVFFKERLAAVRAHRMQGSKEGGGGSGEGDAISDSRIGGYR